MTRLRPAARGFIAAAVAVAVVLVILALTRVVGQPELLTPIAVLVPLYLIALAVPARLATGVVLVVNVPVLIAAYLIGGWQTAALVAAAGVMGRRDGRWDHHVFNTAQFVVMSVVGGLVYESLGGVPVVWAPSAGGLSASVIPLVAASTLAVIVTNLLLMLPILWLAEGIAPASAMRSMVAASIVPYFAYALFGLLMAVLWTIGSGFAASLILIPLLVARWGFQQHAVQREAYEATIRSLVQAVETKDHYTRGHSERVSDASVRIAHELAMREDRVRTLAYAGILHDVGKLGVPTPILQKTGMLSDEEFATIQAHPRFATDIVRGIAFLEEAHAGILHHHERLDGLGYPMGLKGMDIPEFARIIAVADAFDSMTSTRSYRGARTVPEAVAELERCQGTQFDPHMVQALIRSLDRLEWRPAAPSAQRTVDEVARELVEGFDHDDPTVPHPLGHDEVVARAAAEAEAAERAALHGGDHA